MKIPYEFILLRDGDPDRKRGWPDWVFMDPREPDWKHIEFAWNAARLPNQLSNMFYYAFPLGSLKPTLQGIIATLGNGEHVTVEDLKHALKVTRAMARWAHRVRKQTWESRLLIPMTHLALQGHKSYLSRARLEGGE